MLRSLFIFAIILFGAFWAIRGPFYGLLFYTWFAYFRPEYWVWNPTLVLSLRLSLISAAFTLGYMLVSQRLVFTTRTLVMFAFLGWVALSTSLAPVQGALQTTLSDFAKCVIMTWTYVVLIRTPGQLRLFVVVFAVSLGFEGAKQGLVNLVLHPGGANTNTHPMLGDNNGVALGMLGMVPLFNVLAATSEKKWAKWTFLTFSFGVLYRGITTYSRGALLAAVAMLGIYWWRSRHKVRVLVVILLAAAVVVSVMPDAWWDRMATITTDREEMEASASGRLHFWGVALDMLRDRPLFGFGYFGFTLNYDAYDTSFGAYGARRAVHSSWFGVAAETGVVGFGLYVLTFFLAFRACWRVRRLARTDSRFERLQPFAVAFESSLIVVAVASSFLTFHFSEYTWNLFGMTMALDAMCKHILRSPPEESPDRASSRVASPVAGDPATATAP